MSLDTTKADDIALVIEEAIVSGELEPGTVLRQEQLPEQFKVPRTPRFGTNDTSPSAARRRSASRTGVRDTLNCSESCSCRRTVPGASSPETIASSIMSAMSSALVLSRLTPSECTPER